MKPGIYMNLPREKYEAIKAVNYSTLKLFENTPAHAREQMNHPKAPTAAMELGTAIHTAILEPDIFEKNYVQAPRFDRRTKEGKEQWMKFEAENSGKTYLSEPEWEQCQGAMNSVKNNLESRKLLYGPGKNEVTVVWNDEETGLLCKGRLDRFTSYNGWSVIVDVKTTKSAAEGIFATQAARMNYHMQAAFYLDGLKAISPSEHDRRYLIIAIEKDRPYASRIFEFDIMAVEEGRVKYQAYMKKYQNCEKTGEWPGYPDEVTELSLPGWAVGNIYSESEEMYE